MVILNTQIHTKLLAENPLRLDNHKKLHVDTPTLATQSFDSKIFKSDHHLCIERDLSHISKLHCTLHWVLPTYQSQPQKCDSMFPY